jgi:hypothetical protein
MSCRQPLAEASDHDLGTADIRALGRGLQVYSEHGKLREAEGRAIPLDLMPDGRQYSHFAFAERFLACQEIGLTTGDVLTQGFRRKPRE